MQRDRGPGPVQSLDRFPSNMPRTPAPSERRLQGREPVPAHHQGMRLSGVRGCRTHRWGPGRSPLGHAQESHAHLRARSIESSAMAHASSGCVLVRAAPTELAPRWWRRPMTSSPRRTGTNSAQMATGRQSVCLKLWNEVCCSPAQLGRNSASEPPPGPKPWLLRTIRGKAPQA